MVVCSDNTRSPVKGITDLGTTVFWKLAVKFFNTAELDIFRRKTCRLLTH